MPSSNSLRWSAGFLVRTPLDVNFATGLMCLCSCLIRVILCLSLFLLLVALRLSLAESISSHFAASSSRRSSSNSDNQALWAPFHIRWTGSSTTCFIACHRRCLWARRNGRWYCCCREGWQRALESTSFAFW